MDSTHYQDRETMKFISYAQNFEDVILHKALKDVERGFYIDVGANDPVIHSVTKAFYEMGWRGINLEPVDVWFKKLLEDRPEDQNFQVAMSDKVGQQEFLEVVDTGLSTFDETIAFRHERDSGYEKRKYILTTDTLTNICDKYIKEDIQNIHFLKIDVEGAEELTLRGLDLKRIRPWLILVESTAPMTQESTHQSWEPLILANKYHFVYFDGLNRFYIADEHVELDDRFLVPPNIFDGFVVSKNHWLLASETEERKRLEISLASETEERKRLEISLASETEERKRLEINLHEVLSSKLWRLLRPIRFGMRVLIELNSARGVFQRTKQGFKSFLKSIIKGSVAFVKKRPWVKSLILAPLAPFPRVKARLRRAARLLQNPAIITFQQDTAIEHRSSRAQKIYKILKQKIENGGFQ